MKYCEIKLAPSQQKAIKPFLQQAEADYMKLKSYDERRGAVILQISDDGQSARGMYIPNEYATKISELTKKYISSLQ